MFNVNASCPYCANTVEIRLATYFGEGQTEVIRYCEWCKKNFILKVSFGAALIDQVLINGEQIEASAQYKNFEKAQPQRDENKRIRMWRAISSASKRLKQVTDLIAGELPECAKQVNLLVKYIQDTRVRLKSEGVVSNGKQK